MSSQPTWWDARQAAEQLEPIDRDLLDFLAPLPLAPVELLQELAGVSRAYICMRLTELVEAGVIGVALAPLAGCGRRAHLHYLTDLGLAVTALGLGCSVDDLVRRYRLSASGLLVRLRHWPAVTAVYRLLTMLAGSGPAPRELCAWQQPWRGQDDGVSREAVLRLPAYVALKWSNGGAGEWLLFPDPEILPVQAFRSCLTALFRIRAAQGQLPTLLVAVENQQRARQWQGLVEDVRAGLGEADLACVIDTWFRLPVSLKEERGDDWRWPGKDIESGRPAHWNPFEPAQPGRHVPAFVGMAVAEFAGEEWSRGLSVISSGERRFLHLVGQQPFVTTRQIATIQGCNLQCAETRCRRLVDAGFITEVILPASCAGRSVRAFELTRTGLQTLADQYSAAPHALVSQLGLAASGGPLAAVKRRNQLFNTLAHTVGLNDLRRRLVQDVARRRAHGWKDRLVEWRPAATCGSRIARPDAYFVYERGGRRYGAFVEFDRGTERGREYRRKFAAYWEYHDSGAYRDEYDGCPTILVVTVDKAAEDRIVGALLKIAPDRSALPVLVTNLQRVKADPAGLLGPVWRGQEPTFGKRNAWPSLV